LLFKTLEDKILSLFAKRNIIFFLILSLFFLMLIFRLFYLQIYNYDKYKKLSDNNRIRIQRIKADRGFIWDRNGELVARNAPSYNLEIIKEDICKKKKDALKQLLINLNKIVDIDIESSLKKIKRSYYYEPTMIYRGLSFKQVSYIKEHSEQFRGVRITTDSVRIYKHSKTLSHIIGYMGEVTEQDLKSNKGYRGGDLIGKNGVEKYYEDILKGIDGAVQVEVDSFGTVTEVLSKKSPVKGNDLILSIDSRLQEFAAKLLKNKKGSVTILTVDNAEILCLYSSPTYDLNLFVPYISSENWNKLIKDKNKPLMNRALEGAYPPGSVFKILMSLMALKEGVVTPKTKFLCTGEMKYGKFSYKCWKKSGHGKTDLNKGISESCDVYFYNVGLNLGIDTISKYAKIFGLGHKTGIDLPNEKSGFFPDRKWKRKVKKTIWYPGETIITSIGQGYITTTPLQIAVMLSGIFNGGYIYKPKVVKYIGDNPIKPEKSAEFPVPAWIRKQILKGMIDVVYGEHPTGFRAKVDSVKIAGKTGTAQVVSLKKIKHYDKDKIPEKYRDHAWFAALFPANNPKYVVVIMVEHGSSGSRGAAPIAGAIINKMVDLGYVNNK
jgi:penicillin-binding protein 2